MRDRALNAHDSVIRSLHVIPSVSPTQGGPSFAMAILSQALSMANVEVTIATTNDAGRGMRSDVPLGQAMRAWDCAEIYYFRKNFEFYKVSMGLRSWLEDHVRGFDLLHIHSLFSFSSMVAAKIAQRNEVPYVVRPLGVLNEWGMMNRRRQLKRWSLQLLELPLLQRAAAIHYTSEQERLEAGRADSRISVLPSATVPLPVNLESVRGGDPKVIRKLFPQIGNQRVILFLSRIDRKKGVELLLEAFATVAKSVFDVVLLIAGSGEANYLNFLKDLAARLGIAERVIWAGFLEGPDKAAAFAVATVFVLPSYSENFGIAAAEALAAGAPTIIGEGVALAKAVIESDAGVVVKPQTNALAEALTALLSDEARRRLFSANGRRMIEEHFSPLGVGEQMRAVYEWILGGGSPPECVRLV